MIISLVGYSEIEKQEALSHLCRVVTPEKYRIVDVDKDGHQLCMTNFVQQSQSILSESADIILKEARLLEEAVQQRAKTLGGQVPIYIQLDEALENIYVWGAIYKDLGMWEQADLNCVQQMYAGFVNKTPRLLRIALKLFHNQDNMKEMCYRNGKLTRHHASASCRHQLYVMAESKLDELNVLDNTISMTVGCWPEPLQQVCKNAIYEAITHYEAYVYNLYSE